MGRIAAFDLTSAAAAAGVVAAVAVNAPLATAVLAGSAMVAAAGSRQARMTLTDHLD